MLDVTSTHTADRIRVSNTLVQTSDTGLKLTELILAWNQIIACNTEVGKVQIMTKRREKI